MDITELKNKVLAGYSINREEARQIALHTDIDELCDAADELTAEFLGRDVDSCSIVNARSGMCGEDCKWCAQSVRYNTGCETYNFIDGKEVMDAARLNEREGIHRLSLVTSGRAVSEKDLPAFCDIYEKLSADTNLYLCASMGLLSKESLQKLKDAGVKRYHCNFETSSKRFPELCTTHTQTDKLRTLEDARSVGMEICCGGIIGMGENMDDRIDFAFELRDLNPDSVPINILNPIPGTPLENTPLISEDEVIRTVAVFRFILPRTSLRFAGGRMRLSSRSMRRIMLGGMNGVLMGDMLTTVSNTIADDRKMFADCGLNF